MNLPNKITLGRIFLSILIIIIMLLKLLLEYFSKDVSEVFFTLAFYDKIKYLILILR